MLATYQMATDCGTIVGPLVAGALAESVSYGFSFGLSGAVLAVACVCWLGARETLPAKAPVTENA